MLSRLAELRRACHLLTYSQRYCSSQHFSIDSSSELRDADSSAASEAYHFCVVGSGPAGFYTAAELLKRYGERARVDILDRLPTPYGLVRSGVAPDHPDTKNVVNQFMALGRDPRVAFLGNVGVGRDVQLQDLRAYYNAVVLAYGAESNRRLHIEGEARPDARGLRNVFSAREFVWWYNGHPDCSDLPVDLSKVRRVAVLGLGNVAVDCARMLLQAPARLAATDVAGHALAQLARSAVRSVDLIGRRGPVQASFTAKELREVLRLPGVRASFPSGALAPTDADRAEMAASRVRRRIYDIMAAAAAAPQPEDAERDLRLRFLRSPAALLPAAGDATAVGGLRVEVMGLETEDGRQRAVGTGHFETLEADMVLSSIGYRSEPLQGVPFDPRLGVIPNREGRVLAADGASTEPGLYACGWVKRGPTGIIGTNLFDASETAAAVAEDAAALPAVRAATPGGAGLWQALRGRGVQVVSFEDWLRIDAAEVARGQALGKPREKLVDVAEMLALCR